MEDMERYGDYNEIDEVPGHRSPLGWVMRILVIFTILLVVGFLGFRLVLFDYYPSSVKNLYFNDTLTEYYNKTSGKLGAKTQYIRFPYDDSREGNFFVDHLIVIDGADQLQIALRMNTSTVEKIEQKYGLSGLSTEDFSYLSFRLYDNKDRVLGSGGIVKTDSIAMYRYFKLVFDGVDVLERADGEEASAWIRLEVFVAGGDAEVPFAKLPIYENNADNLFTDYEPSRKERPV